jgi:hypothetical protein
MRAAPQGIEAANAEAVLRRSLARLKVAEKRRRQPPRVG